MSQGKCIVMFPNGEKREIDTGTVNLFYGCYLTFNGVVYKVSRTEFKKVPTHYLKFVGLDFLEAA